MTFVENYTAYLFWYLDRYVFIFLVFDSVDPDPSWRSPKGRRKTGPPGNDPFSVVTRLYANISSVSTSFVFWRLSNVWIVLSSSMYFTIYRHIDLRSCRPYDFMHVRTTVPLSQILGDRRLTFLVQGHCRVPPSAWKQKFCRYVYSFLIRMFLII